MADERIEQREPPASLIALREELPNHPLIYEEAKKGRNFEECLATIAYMLDIALDGMYDVEELCDLLVKELKRVGAISLDGTSTGKVRDSRLVAATLVEMGDRIVIEKGTLEVQEVDGEERLGIVDEDAGTSVLLVEETTTPANKLTASDVLRRNGSEPFLQDLPEELTELPAGHETDMEEKAAEDQKFH